MRSRLATWRWVGLSVGGVIIFTVGAMYVAYSRDMQTRLKRMSTESQVIPTGHGPLEFTTWGSGPAVLVVHGAGGGYDQARSIAKAFGGGGFR